MATFFDKLIQEIGSRYCIGPKACPLVQETLGLITGQPGGIGDFLNTFKAPVSPPRLLPGQVKPRLCPFRDKR